MLLVTEGRGLKAVPREPPPLVLWSRTCPGGHQSHQCPQQGGQGWGSFVGIQLRASHPERRLLNSWELCSGGFFLPWNSHQHSSALGSVRCSGSIWSWKVWLIQLSKTAFLYFRKSSPILVSPLCGQVVSGGSKWDFCCWVLYPPLAGAGKCANPCKYLWG